MSGENCIEVLDYRNENVIFTEKKRIEKSKTHPELNSATFIKNVKKTIKNPDEVWQDYDNAGKKRCYYKKYSSNTYVKVVIWIHGNPNYVVTAFETDYIKEINYPQLKRLK